MDFGSYGIYILSLVRARFYKGFKGQAIIVRCAVESVEDCPGQPGAWSNYPVDKEFDVQFKMNLADQEKADREEATFIRFVRAVQGYEKTPKNWDPDQDVAELLKAGKWDRGTKLFCMDKSPGNTKEYEVKKDGKTVIENGEAVTKSITYDKTKYTAVVLPAEAPAADVPEDDIPF